MIRGKKITKLDLATKAELELYMEIISFAQKTQYFNMQNNFFS